MTFNRLNLIKPPYPISGKFDGILCRNVMIYFDQDTRDALAERLIDHLHVGGVFVTGQAESIGGRYKRLKSIRPFGVPESFLVCVKRGYILSMIRRWYARS